MVFRILLIFIAAFLKAFADANAFHRYMANKGAFWDVAKGKYIPYTKYRFNSWHVANSLMICCFVYAITLKIWFTLIIGIAFILVFNFFYNKVFK